jgi:DNA-binding transcriptional LysR family regulator
LIDLNDMRLFARVVEAGSFSAAARGLGMPKSTVSRRVARLEQALDTRLLQRTTRSLHMTEPGTAFYERCARVVAEAEEAERSLSMDRDVPQGLLRVTAPVEVGNAVLGALVAEYLQRYPRVSLRLELSNQMVDLVEEGFDLAIRAGWLPDSSMVARRVGDSRLLVCASPAYLAGHPAPQTPEELGEHACSSYAGLGDAGNSFEFEPVGGGPGERQRLRLQGRFSASSFGPLVDAAIAGLGVVVVPESLCRSALADGRLQALLPDWRLLPELGIYAVYPSPRHRTPKVRSFIDFIGGRL